MLERVVRYPVHVKEVKQMANRYYMYDDGAIRYCDFSGFDTSKTYYMVMWKADNSKSVVGIGQIGSFGKVVDYI